MDYVTLVGTVGATLILVAFILNQIGKWSNQSLSYDVVNVIGSMILLYYAWLLSSVPFLVLNSVWMLVSLKDVAMGLYRLLKSS